MISEFPQTKPYDLSMKLTDNNSQKLSSSLTMCRYPKMSTHLGKASCKEAETKANIQEKLP